MTAIMGFLTSRLGIGIIGIVGVLLMYVGWSIQVSGLRSDISREQQNTRFVQSQFDSYKLMVEQQISDERAARLVEVQKALAQRDRLQEEADRLQTAAAIAERRRVQASNQLLEALRHAPQVDTSPLGPAARSYIERVREQQNAGTAGDPAPP